MGILFPATVKDLGGDPPMGRVKEAVYSRGVLVNDASFEGPMILRVQ